MTKKEIRDILWGIGCNSWNRYETFLTIASKLEKENYWYGLRIAYEGSDNLYIQKKNVYRAFSKNEPCKNALMSKEERKYLKSLPDQITIFRGMTELELKSKNFGVSWTLKKEVAQFFSETYQRNYSTKHLPKTIHSIDIEKSKVVAFFNKIKEFEIIYLHSK